MKFLILLFGICLLGISHADEPLSLKEEILSRLFYYPSYRFSWNKTPEDFNVQYEEITLYSHDGTRINSWHLRPPGTSLGLIVFFHGNAGNISTHLNSYFWLSRFGFDVLVFDYRGFGKSHGMPSRRGVREDGVAALLFAHQLKEKLGLPKLMWDPLESTCRHASLSIL